MRKHHYLQSGPSDSVLRTYKFWAQFWAHFTLARVRKIASCGRVALRYSLKVKLVCGLAAAGAYFAAALWLKASYVDPAPQGSLVIQLLPPFSNEGGYSWRVTSPLPAAWTRMAGAEPAMIYEGDYPLVFRDSNWREISTVGQGHFLIEGNVIMFSTSDNSDPATNGRYYWAVVPR